MPIPRRFDRRPPERDQTRINERIRVPEVRLIAEDGQQVGVVSRDDALRYAQERELDLVEVAAEARPPVCRVLDYSKYKYEQEQKAKQARKHQKQVTVREIKLRPKIADNDYETKKGHVERFLRHQDRVKITIMFRGRETTHPERGERLLMRLAEDIVQVGTIEQRPNLDGRNMTMVLAPVKGREGATDEMPALSPAEGSAPAATDASPQTEASTTPASEPAEAGTAPRSDPATPDAVPASEPSQDAASSASDVSIPAQDPPASAGAA
ncbi:MAG: translation initiation factor IF-3 [Thermoleophilaceae bacterium]